jgi:hypothetical protein
VADEGQIHVLTQDRWLLPVVLIALAIISIGLGWWLVGAAGALAAAAASMSCGAGVLAGSAVASLFTPTQVLERMGAGMILRMFIPLGAFLILYFSSPALVEAGLAYYMITIYLCLLTVETLLSVRQLQALDLGGGAG